jgi:hypothetical protein
MNKISVACNQLINYMPYSLTDNGSKYLKNKYYELGGRSRFFKPNQLDNLYTLYFFCFYI